MTWHHRRVGQRVLVLYAGFIIEEAPVKEYMRIHNTLYPGVVEQPARMDEMGYRRLISINGMPRLY